MGCDIHVCIEKHSPQGGWYGIWGTSTPILPRLFFFEKGGRKETSYLHSPLAYRNYEFFAAIAGVRGEGPEANGLPDDISPFAQDFINCLGDGGHSHCHFSLEFFLNAHLKHSDSLEDFAKRKLNNGDLNLLRYYFDNDSTDEDINDYRVICYFDN